MKARYTANTMKTLKPSGSFRRCITNRFAEANNSTVILGKDDTGSTVLLDLAKAPHVLVAGTTGSGKSVMLHNMIASLLLRNTTDTASLLIIDPKMVEFKYFYEDHPLLWMPIVVDPFEALDALESAHDEMTSRYEDMSERGLRIWDGPKLYIFIDEVADLIDTAGKDVERVISSLARLGRGAGVHLVVATQHPTSKVLSRQITANLDTRIGLRTDDNSASRLVIRATGCEHLKGKGDALLRNEEGIKHFQGAYITDDELYQFAHSYKLEAYSPMLKGFKKFIKSSLRS